MFSYPVSPGQPPSGGQVPVTASVNQALDEAYQHAAVDQGKVVTFVFEDGADTNPVRDALISIAFDDDQEANEAAAVLAGKLADAMDRRSTPGLLVVSVHGSGDVREVVLWTFPRDEAFRHTGEELDLIDDVFSRSSNLRKAASFRGRRGEGEFITGRVVDFQANSVDRYVADYWVKRFLQASVVMTGEQATMLFAKTVKQAIDRLDPDADAQGEIVAAVSGIGNQPRRMSVRAFVDENLNGAAAETVLRSAPHAGAVDAIFELQPDRLRQILRYRVFHLDTGVTVSVPMDSVGEAVLVGVDGDGRVVETRGRVVDETVRTRGG